MAKVEFKVNGKPLRSGPNAIVHFLDKLPFGELVTTAELSERLDISRWAVQGLVVSLRGHNARANRSRVWGSPATVTELNKQLGQEIHV